MKRSDSIKNIAAALIKFQGMSVKISKDSTNPHFGKKYASLSTIIETTQKPLTDCGLAITQWPDEGQLITLLIHAESGEYFEGSYPLNPSKPDPQGVGSAITYARRYCWGAILGLNIDDDDDGNAASAAPLVNGKAKPATKPEKPTIDGERFTALLASIEAGEVDKKGKVIDAAYAKVVFSLTPEQEAQVDNAEKARNIFTPKTPAK